MKDETSKPDVFSKFLKMLYYINLILPYLPKFQNDGKLQEEINKLFVSFGQFISFFCKNYPAVAKETGLKQAEQKEPNETSED